jgi:hypothetical protein
MSQRKDLEKKHSLMIPSATPEWVARMQEHYGRTGSYRVADVRRVLGDPSRRVEIGGSTDVTALFKSR